MLSSSWAGRLKVERKIARVEEDADGEVVFNTRSEVAKRTRTKDDDEDGAGKEEKWTICAK